MTWVPNLWFVIGGCMVSVTTIWVSNWRTYTWIFAASSIPLFVCPLLFLDSPKWLAKTSDRKKVWEVMKGICKANGRPEPAEPPQGESTTAEPEQEESSAQVEDFRALLHPKIFSRLIFSSLLWMMASYSYYGLSSFNPPELFPGNPVLSWCFGFAVEFPAYTLSGVMINTPSIGRKGVAAGGIVLGAVGLLIVAVKPYAPENLGWFFDVLYYPSRMVIAAAFGVIYPWSAELFPTSIRNTAMGINSACARVGSSLAPWVGEITPFSVRMLWFSIPAGVAGIAPLLFLPETYGRPLPGSTSDLDLQSHNTKDNLEVQQF